MVTEPDKPKHKRRWFRFSLKTFVVVLAVFCVWLGLLVYRVNKQREAVQWVKDMGAGVDNMNIGHGRKVWRSANDTTQSNLGAVR